jgi:hypothetical protein
MKVVNSGTDSGVRFTVTVENVRGGYKCVISLSNGMQWESVDQPFASREDAFAWGHNEALIACRRRL